MLGIGSVQPLERFFGLVEAHESDLSVASEVTQARVTEALKVGAETYEGELEMDYLSRLAPIR